MCMTFIWFLTFYSDPASQHTVLSIVVKVEVYQTRVRNSTTHTRNSKLLIIARMLLTLAIFTIK